MNPEFLPATWAFMGINPQNGAQLKVNERFGLKATVGHELRSRISRLKLLFVSKRNDRFDAHRAARRNKGSKQRDQQQ